jgi:hypothetical protein
MKENRTRIDQKDEHRKTTLRKHLAAAQQIVRRYVAPTTSMVDELIADAAWLRGVNRILTRTDELLRLSR